MQATLFDEHGAELTEITSRVGRSAGQMLVDWATRPDALLQYYFGGRRTVTLVSNEEQYSAVLGTRWQMGTRFWLLHEFKRVRSVPVSPLTRSTQDEGLAAAILHAEHANANHGVSGDTSGGMLD